LAKKERVIIMTNSNTYEEVELKNILDEIAKKKLEEMYGKIK
jgi:hypothetical protein